MSESESVHVKTYGFINFYSIDDGVPVGYLASFVSVSVCIDVVVTSILLLKLLVQVDLT